MKIEICLGSSCHVKGSQEILELLKAAIKENGIEDKVELAGTTCLGECKSDGVNMRADGAIIKGVTEANFNEIFSEKILGVLKA